MKLDRYDVTITISDPDEPGTACSMKLERCSREKVMEWRPIHSVMQIFEEMVGQPPEEP